MATELTQTILPSPAYTLAGIKMLRDQFAREMVGMALRPYQVELSDRIIESVFAKAGDEIVALWARQMGKTEALALTGLFLFIFYPRITGQGFKIGVFGPKYEQAQNLVERMRLRLSKSWLDRGECWTDTGMRFSWVWTDLPGQPVSEWHGISGSKDAHIEGPSFDLLYLDESQDIEESQMKTAIFPMGAAKMATRVLIGTYKPQVVNFYFYQRTMEHGRHLSKKPWTVGAEFSDEYRRYVLQEKDRYGEESEEFRTQYSLNLVEHKAFFISRPDLLALRVDELPTDLEDSNFVGIDIAKFPDSTVAECYRGKFMSKGCLVDALELQGVNYEDQVLLLKDFCECNRAKVVVVDSTGVGDPVVDMLKRALRCRVEGLKLTLLSKDSIFKNLQGEMLNRRLFYHVRPDRKREVARFEDQFLALLREFRGAYMDCHHPETRDAHDDYCFAAALAVEAARLQTGFIYDFLDTV